MKRSPLGSRRATVAASAAVLALTISACGSVTGSTTPAASGPASGSASADRAVVVGQSGTVDQFKPISEVCGTKPVTVGLVDGIGLNSWSKTVLAELRAEAAQCENITKVQFVAGRGDLQATLSGINSLATQGYQIILAIPDAGPGPSHLSALRSAQQSGAQVVAFASDPGGTRGTDYLDYVDWNPEFIGETWAKWAVDRLGSEGGNVVFLGGPAGNAVSELHMKGVKKVFAANSQVELLTPEPVTTNWDPAMAQQAMSGLLAKHPDIDAVIVDYGATATGVIRAFQSANRDLVPVATTDSNELSCKFASLKSDNASYELATVSSRTWSSRLALRKAMAAYQGLPNAEPSIINLGLFEDSAAGDSALDPKGHCDDALPSDATPSSMLTDDQLGELFKN